MGEEKGSYWNKGGGQQTMSLGVRSIRSPIALPLFRMDLCVRQAALGVLVVLSPSLSTVHHLWGGRHTHW